MPGTQVCVVLAGGLGTRLRSVIADRPKCLAPVGERSFLYIQLHALAAAGVQEVVLSLGHLAQQVVNEVKRQRWPLSVRWVVEDQPLGTGGAVIHVLDRLGLDEVLVANGDTHLEGDLGAMLQPLQRAGDELFRIAVVDVPERARFGGVQVSAAGRLERFLEKGQTGPGPINAGLYRLCRAALPDVGRPCSLETDVLPTLVAKGQVAVCKINGVFIDIGIPEDYERYCRLQTG